MKKVLIIHKDKAPEFVEVGDSVKLLADPPRDGELRYESMGNIYIEDPVNPKDENGPTLRSWIRAFIHPVLREEIRSKGQGKVVDYRVELS